MKTINITADQLELLRSALDFYIKIADLQLEEIAFHPAINDILIQRSTRQKQLDIGDSTNLGKVVDLSKEWVWVENSVNNTKVVSRHSRKEIRLNPDWIKYHKNKSLLLQALYLVLNLIDAENIGPNTKTHELKKIRKIMDGH
jgi:hypothetical protein